jgi:desulfoferrodoxin (superoxide reductase-like protein)
MTGAWSFPAPTSPALSGGCVPKFVIERQIPGIGKSSAADLAGISQKSNSVLHDLNTAGYDIQWIHSYVTDDKIFCVYNAPSADIIREHAMRGNFPANAVMKVHEVIEPITAEMT